LGATHYPHSEYQDTYTGKKGSFPIDHLVNLHSLTGYNVGKDHGRYYQQGNQKSSESLYNNMVHIWQFPY